jgi:hypothetical protein
MRSGYRLSQDLRFAEISRSLNASGFLLMASTALAAMRPSVKGATASAEVSGVPTPPLRSDLVARAFARVLAAHAIPVVLVMLILPVRRRPNCPEANSYGEALL